MAEKGFAYVTLRAMREFERKIRTQWASESVTMRNVYAVQRLNYVANNCKYFKNCPFLRHCLVDIVVSIDLCETLIKMIGEGLIEIKEADSDA